MIQAVTEIRAYIKATVNKGSSNFHIRGQRDNGQARPRLIPILAKSSQKGGDKRNDVLHVAALSVLTFASKDGTTFNFALKIRENKKVATGNSLTIVLYAAPAANDGQAASQPREVIALTPSAAITMAKKDAIIAETEDGRATTLVVALKDKAGKENKNGF